MAAALKKSHIQDAEKEAELILREATGIDRVSIYRDNPALAAGQAEKALEVVERRKKREPLQYIFGYAEFFGLRIKVGRGVLVPRPETETLVEEAIKRAQTLGRAKDIGAGEEGNKITIADLCTGSGAIAIALAKNLPGAMIYATDVSEEALRYAEENKRLHSAQNVTFIKGSLFEGIVSPSGGGINAPLDIIASNPPYIKTAIIEGLDPEVKDWEPRGALDGDVDGLAFYREIFAGARILAGAPGRLKPGGLIIVEIADGQKEEVSEIARAFGFELVSAARDHMGVERVLTFRCSS